MLIFYGMTYFVNASGKVSVNCFCVQVSYLAALPLCSSPCKHQNDSSLAGQGQSWLILTSRSLKKQLMISRNYWVWKLTKSAVYHTNTWHCHQTFHQTLPSLLRYPPSSFSSSSVFTFLQYILSTIKDKGCIQL